MTKIVFLLLKKKKKKTSTLTCLFLSISTVS